MMRTWIDPPLERWRLGPLAGAERRALAPLVEEGAAAGLEGERPILATGHQPWLWHPGIFAKDLAVVSGARRLGATPLHLLVDHDVLDPVALELPVQRAGRLDVERVRLGPANPAVPVGAQPALDAAEAIAVLRETRDRLGEALAADVQPLIEAIDATRGRRHASLAQQLGAWTANLMRPYCGDVPMASTSALLHTAPGEALIAAIVADARRCVRCYNAAVAQHPDAGVPPLVIERERVELPIWALHWAEPRQRVFADLADTTPLLTFEDGTPLLDASGDGHGGRWLAPRALLLTALMRSRFCDLFVHGKGGGVYDRAAEHWWRGWRDEALAPMAVVSADVWLSFDAPVADGEELARAQWYRHHAPFNVDRLLGLDGPLARQKRRLIDEMGVDRDRWRRWLAFREVGRINAALRATHPEVMGEAEQRLADARQGLANARIAAKRDWCFALYPPAELESLREALERAVPVCP